MIALDNMREFIIKNKDKKIALFTDMDGVICNLDVDVNKNISLNTKGYFLKKRPLKTVIKTLEEISKFNNVTLHILSACSYKNQAIDKTTWLENNLPIIKKENQFFLIREIAKYTKENKAILKVNYIINTLRDKGFDLAIYIEDEYIMLREAHRVLKDKVLPVHISHFID